MRSGGLSSNLYSLFPVPYSLYFERIGYGISAASGLPELWIAGWNNGGLDYGRHGIDQQLLQTVRLSYLPLAPLGTAGTPLVSIEGRYARPRRGEIMNEPLVEIAWAFSLPGQWTTIDPNSVDFDPNSGELTLPWNMLGLPYNEVTVTYTAGLATIGDDVKTACAQIVRNAQSTPALNASKTKIDTMQMQYFSSSLVDETVQAWLRPYVANRLG
jgi:hypothetical protein